VTIVVGVKSTVAAVLSRCVSWMVVPDTDLTRPSTVAIGGAGAGGGLGAVLVGLTDVLGFAVF